MLAYTNLIRLNLYASVVFWSFAEAYTRAVFDPSFEVQ